MITLLRSLWDVGAESIEGVEGGGMSMRIPASDVIDPLDRFALSILAMMEGENLKVCTVLMVGACKALATLRSSPGQERARAAIIDAWRHSLPDDQEAIYGC